MGEPTSSLWVGRNRCGFDSQAVISQRLRGIEDDLVARRTAVFERKIEAFEGEFEIDHRSVEQPQRFEQQFLSGLVALEDDEGRRAHNELLALGTKR